MLASPSSEVTALEFFPRLLLFLRIKKEDPVVVTTKENRNRNQNQSTDALVTFVKGKMPLIHYGPAFLPLGQQRISPAGAKIRHLKKQRIENCTRECCGVTVRRAK
jgi:hypothetical protein